MRDDEKLILPDRISKENYEVEKYLQRDFIDVVIEPMNGKKIFY